ncbi:MAG: chromosome segregation protein SMC, partial [Thermoplasmata archaeon]
AVQDKKSHGFALDLISFRKEYESAFWYVFGDTVVVENLDSARQLMGGVRLVTLDGDVVEASGAMKGGSVKEHVAFSQVDRSKLDEAEDKLRKALEAQDALMEKINGLRGEIEKLHGELQELNANTPVALDNLEVQRKEFSGRINVVSSELEEKFREKKEFEDELSDIDKRIEEFQAKLDELERVKEEKGKLLLKGKGKDLTQRVRELEKKLFSIKDDLVQLKGNYDSLKKQLEFMESRREEYSSKVKELDDALAGKKELLEKLVEDKTNHREELEALLSVESKMTGKIKGLSEEKEKVFRETVSLETEIDKITTRIESYIDLISRTTYRIPTIEETLQDLEEEIARYDVSVDISDLPSVESLMESAKLIEENMHELEPVNMRALEEYEHQAKRKEKLEEDIQHLREQKRNLNRVVKEIVKKKKDRFYEVFNEINDNFRQVYSQLSEGGEASLELENPEAPFEGGLTIKVRPRGKKVLHLNALSGGEKSMASLALIFAIQNYDPSPFYVLDEVDMYLDSINAEAVSRMIKENASHTQFIMVSLRKVAIKEADHIYGVTMREDGITEMIGTVDLSSIGPKGEIITTGKGGGGG